MKKVLALILASVLFFTILSGCGGSGGTNESKEPSQNDPGQSTAKFNENSSEYFKFDPATGTILGFKDTVSGITEIDIPAEIDGVTVSRIGDNAFNFKGLTSVMLPASIEYIGSNAFKENKIAEIILPENLKELGFGAFWDNMLTEIIIPEGITNLSIAAFRDNQISKITFPGTLTVIGRGAFQENMLTELTLPENIVTIESGAFQNNRIESLVLNEGLEEIGGYAFEKNQLTSITIPASVKRIGPASEGAVPARNYKGNSFLHNNLTSVTILGDDTEIDEFMMGGNNYFRDAYYEGGAGTYEGEQLSPWEKVSDN
ncbi:MAG TPA: leucine-rich repeat domain-containing protein [Clostridia bacterium]|nr:leucine-rich repeat domain-containing protein [Clostridia bacterium]HPQ46337.1 leucine-rich repeat domain-containing protein [Clostridia bacterium]HRX43181.1 leucine-rich repeat domain-containing protein [Clostridia bacterium]